ncbi:MAG: hypothetical protein COW84_10495 [Gammaproteobacteria bacterium CG22_combo_CG10-13_8_21_14_all_40_8]|nr:MAG: hypothetical protein COW84_10495 [Gammaproteobacteria bacterium CG22_combo_CG10-13_8_21_14_all_40_8]
MNKLTVALTAALGLVSVSSFNMAQAETMIMHHDFRQTPQIVLNPDNSFNTQNLIKQNDDVEIARSYLKTNAARYQISPNLMDFILYKTKDSLLGRHFHFKQQLYGLDIYQAEIVVTVNSHNHQITKVYNNTFPLNQSINKQMSSVLSSEQALTKAWDFLQGAGELISEPKSELMYVNEGKLFRLVYVTQLNATSPQGSWQQMVDAKTGQIVTAHRVDLPIHASKNHNGLSGKVMAPAKNKDHISLVQALAKFEKKQFIAKAQGFKTVVNGTAKVFDPDPRTTLMNDTLEDTSSESSFDLAYLSRDLLEITESSGTYTLDGPWVNIRDIEAPSTAPSTTNNGDWSGFKRGNNAFNDANTYFHIDQSQRYIQSLGFTGSKGIQESPISVDTDGENGADNSHFDPNINSLVFGHGCVDDNEDADVILHEYGHGLQFSMNNNWSGGDTGAMGEGFGDYWAGSYSYRTPNGQNFHPEWAFSWDGHNACWPGRVMNQTSFQHQPGSSYAAHAVVNGILGDELWSTPLFQSLVELTGMGIDHSEVDQIVLESHFGLGSGVTMPEMALSTVQAAQTLFPTGPHAATFESKFKQVNILGSALTAGDMVVTGLGANNVADPGETVSIQVPLSNSDVGALSAVNGELSSTTSGVTIPVSQSTYPDIASQSTVQNNTLYQVSIPSSHICGANVDLNLDVSYQDASAQTASFPLTLETGVRGVFSGEISPNLAIPDNNNMGITSSLTLSGGPTLVDTSQFSVSVNITHSFRGDLVIRLTSPSGTQVLLKGSANDEAADVIGTYPIDLTPVGDLNDFNGETLNGTWQLKVSDNAALDTGTLNSWSIQQKGDASCNTGENRVPVAAVASSNLNASSGGTVSLNASNSSDPDGDTLSFSWVQTSGSNVNLTDSSSAVATFTAPTVTSETNLGFSVTVSDTSGATDTADVTVVVSPAVNHAPVAVISVPTQTVTQGATVSLNATSSTDEDGDTLSYLWTQTSGTSVSLTNSTTSQASFLAPSVSSATTFNFMVTVTDSSGASSTANASVTVNPATTPPPAPTPSSSGGGSLGILSLWMLVLTRGLKNSKLKWFKLS